MTEPHGPLQGVKVVACSTAQAGTVPYMLMADLGAEVIKIEVPDGRRQLARLDRAAGHAQHLFRDQQPRREERHAQPQVRRKAARSCTSWSPSADIFGQNFRPGAAEKNGFGYEELRKINPKLVYVSISGYGPKGPNADLPGTDSMAQALGGIARGLFDAGPAVEDRHRLGRRRDLRHPRLRRRARRADPCARHRHRPEGRLLAARRADPADGLDPDHDDVAQPQPGHRPGPRHRHAASGPGISASFNDRDGKPLVFQLNGAGNWKDAMTALGFYEALEKAGFGDLGVIDRHRTRSATTLLRMLDDLFATGTRDDWVARLRGADIVSAPINTLLEASNDPDVLANGYVTEVDYPKHGKR